MLVAGSEAFGADSSFYGVRSPHRATQVLCCSGRLESALRIAFAGDRDIGVRILQYIIDQGVRPLALLLPERASHAGRLTSTCSFLNTDKILRGPVFRSKPGLQLLSELTLDYLISVHFPYIIPNELLTIPRRGCVNLHPAYLPYNRGWHTASWMILEDTPAGATLHCMDAGVDTGDIIYQESLPVSLADTADSLYRRLKELEFQVFTKAWPLLVAGSFSRVQQDPAQGTEHKKKDLFRPEVQRIELDTPIKPRDLLRQLRALTTNRIDEAACFDHHGTRYRVQVRIIEQRVD